MVATKSIVLLLIFAAGFVHSLENTNGISEPPQPESPTTTPSTNTTVTPPTTPSTNTTTVTPPTTPSTNTTTVTPPTPPTPPTNTTTVTPPTTPPSNTTTVTPPTPPTNTTVIPPVTTTESPEPSVGNWSVSDKTSNIVCIIADMAVQLKIPYTTIHNETKTATIDIPQNSSATGECGNVTQDIQLQWTTDNVTNELVLIFSKEKSNFQIKLINLTLAATETNFPDIKDNGTINMSNNKTEFTTPVTKSYHCDKVQSFEMMGNKTNGTISFSHVQLEAFHENKDYNFGEAEDCEGSGSSPDIVPIAVGCALVGLVAIVLIAYLVGRRRSQARGYLSM